jgi:ATP-dependent DNA helicase RecQ
MSVPSDHFKKTNAPNYPTLDTLRPMAPPSPSISRAERDSAAALNVLQQVYGYPDFRGPQKDIIEHVIQGHDALVLMPTGGGKSLCFQVPALVRHARQQGVTLVVSPLIALMQDQVSALEELGVAAAYLNSTQEPSASQAIERQLLQGQLALIYAAPERLLTPRFLAILDSLHERGLLSLFAIDEAHCVSQWGHDFREDYLQLAQLHERYPKVPRLALTATADARTRADVAERLSLSGARCFISSFDRPNIRYTIEEKDDPRAQLLRFIRGAHANHAGIVYCSTRKRVEDIAVWLNKQGVAALPYHAGLEPAVRQRHQTQFVQHDGSDGGLVMVATIAFGMGIDKPDVRFVAHLDLPRNIESYYQETGRAGRDGLPADAWMVYGLADVVAQRRLIDDGDADDSFKRLQRQRLDLLLALAETHECRRQRLLDYFGEASKPCGNCDNCLNPPEQWDATEPARMALSALYRMAQHGRHTGVTNFGAGHLLDMLLGRETPKMKQYGHAALSTFAIGRGVEERTWRAVLRQLVAQGLVTADGEYPVLALTDEARGLLKGEATLWLKRSSPAANDRAAPRPARGDRERSRASAPDLLEDAPAAAQQRFQRLKAWRAARARDLQRPAYVIFHDSVLAELALEAPDSLEALGRVSGVGARKLEAYGDDLLATLAAA